MGRLASAMTRLFTSQRTSDGIPGATIARGEESCSATIVLGRGDQVATNEQGFSVESDTQDLLIAAAEYQPTGTPSRPMLGDAISATVAGNILNWLVVERGPDRQTYAECDPEGTELRVHVISN